MLKPTHTHPSIHTHTYIYTYICENEKWFRLNWRTNKMNSKVLQCCGIEQDFISELVDVYLQLKINAMKL